jgi:glutathione S-transferase
MLSDMTSPQTIKLSVLRWAPPIVHGLVRDLRARWALEEAGLPYEEHFVSQNDQRSESYRALQPWGQVPALQIDGLALFETGAIVMYIAERSPVLMPKDPHARAEVTAWMFGALNSLEPPIMMLNIIDMTYGGPKGADVQALRAHIIEFIESRLDGFVAAMAGKDYVHGRFSAADILLSCVLRILRDTDLVKARPALDAYQRRCEARPAFQKALADHMASFSKHAPPGAA